MPLKSLAVTKYPQLVKKTQLGCFSFNEHLRYCNTKDQQGCIETDRLSGSYFQIYFHDRHLFQIHHVLLLLLTLHVIPGGEKMKEKKILVTACIAMYKVSWQWTLIILWIIRYHFYLAQEVQAYIQTCNLSPVFSPDRPKEDARKRQNLANVESSDEEYFCEIEARFRQPYYMFDPL